MTQSTKRRSDADKAKRRAHRSDRRRGAFLVVRRTQPIVPRPTRKHEYPAPPREFPPLLIGKNSMLLSKDWEENTPIAEKDIDAVFFRKMFFYNPLFWFMTFWANFVAPLFVSSRKICKKNSRGEYKCVCFGIHEQVGHGTIHWTPATKWNGFFGRAQLRMFTPIFKTISEAVQSYYPTIAHQLTQGVPEEYRLFGLFTYGMFHLSPVELAHVDYNDYGICVVVPLGSAFTGGSLCFNYLNVEYSMKPGDMIVFRSCKLLHSVTQVVSGLRQSLVITSQKKVVEVLQSGITPT